MPERATGYLGGGGLKKSAGSQEAVTNYQKGVATDENPAGANKESKSDTYLGFLDVRTSIVA